jgi:hypothetical protein
MFIESTDELLSLIENKSIVAMVLKGNSNFHPRLTSAISLYIRIGKNSYIVPIAHPDGNTTSYTDVAKILNQAKEVFVPNKKDFLYYFTLRNLKDLTLAGFVPEDSKNNAYAWMYSRYETHPEVNKMIPLVKHLEKLDRDYEEVDLFIEKFEPSYAFNFYNDIAVPVFFLAEQQGLRVTYQPYLDLFKPGPVEYNTKDNIVFTSYNLYNTTSRPTNAFNSVNFAAIPKKEEYRKCFIPQNDMFVEFDFDGYHLRLLADQVGYELTSESAHVQLAREYFGKSEITPEDYIRAKQINFQALYGNIPFELKEFKLFNLLEIYTKDLWGNFIDKGYVNAPISGKVFSSKEHTDMNPKKLLNYIIQSLETSRNILILRDVFKYLQNKKTKVSLYTYDSILFDFNKLDGKQTLQELEEILSESGKYPVKFKFANSMFF